MKKSARILRGKALSSMRTAIGAFNSPQDDGRLTTVLLHLHHAFEMLLKAALENQGRRLIDRKSGRSIGFEAALRQAQQLPSLGVTNDQAGLLRTIKALRDDEEHWFSRVEEQLLYLHIRAAVTVFDELLWRAFQQRLADHLPNRVLPISTGPPQDFLTLVDSEFARIKELLAPGRRASEEARARIRALLALEAHVQAGTVVSDADVQRVAKGIKAGGTRHHIFPRLSRVSAEISGHGSALRVRFVKTGEALPVRLVRDDQDVDAAAVREVDLLRKYHWTASRLAAALGLSVPKSAALREHLGIDGDPSCRYTLPHNASTLARYSDKARDLMRAALTEQDLGAIWAAHRSSRRARPACTQPGCTAGLGASAAS